jgi:hypothetical protein
MSTPDSTAAQWAALGGCDGVPHDLTAEIMTAHPGRPTPAEAVAMGVTPASGSGKGGSDYGPSGGPIGGM